MKKLIILSVAVALSGCSQEQREDAIDRVTSAAKELNGAASRTPSIVAEARRKEKRRQDTQWTKENQANHPVEYCQAQLEELDALAKSLQVQVHSLAITKASIQRKRNEANDEIRRFSKALKDAKDAYRTAEATNKWPMALNGFQLSRERAEQKIVDMAQKIAMQKEVVEKGKNVLGSLEKKSLKLDAEQRKLVAIREKVQTTLEDLKTKQVVDGADGISDALDAISDSMVSLGVDVSDPSIDELVIPAAGDERVRMFKEIMADE